MIPNPDAPAWVAPALDLLAVLARARVDGQRFVHDGQPQTYPDTVARAGDLVEMLAARGGEVHAQAVRTQVLYALETMALRDGLPLPALDVATAHLHACVHPYCRRPDAAGMIALVRRHWAPGAGYLVLEQVAVTPASPGWADAVVVGTWKVGAAASRVRDPARRRLDYEVIGVEVKVSRGDWLRELRNPEKSAGIARHCDRWYVAAATDKVVRPGELPQGWGLLVPRVVATGRTLAAVELEAVVPAPLLRPDRASTEPLDRAFVASLMRRTSETYTAGGRLQAAADWAERSLVALAERLGRFLHSAYDDRETRELSQRLRSYVQGAHKERSALLGSLAAQVSAAAAEPE